MLLLLGIAITAGSCGGGGGGPTPINELYVVNTINNSITVYSRTANGNIAPVRTISGGTTGLNGPAWIAVLW